MNRYKETKVASILGIIGNIFLLIIKLIIGLLTKSQAMISDAVNSAGDIFSSFMTFVGNHISSRKPDDDHNLGHGKAEYIFSLLISLTIIVISLKLIYTSFLSIFIKREYKFSIYLILVCIITIFIKFMLFLYTSRISKKYNNILMYANSKDHINDCFLTLSTLIASICGYFNLLIVDSIVGILLSFWIFIQGIILFKKSYDVLMDKSMNDDVKNEVIRIVGNYKEIKKINHFNSTPVGYQYQISLTIFVDGNLSTFESHKIADKLEKELTKLDEVYLAIIHVNPI